MILNLSQCNCVTACRRAPRAKGLSPNSAVEVLGLLHHAGHSASDGDLTMNGCWPSDKSLSSLPTHTHSTAADHLEADVTTTTELSAPRRSITTRISAIPLLLHTSGCILIPSENGEKRILVESQPTGSATLILPEFTAKPSNGSSMSRHYFRLETYWSTSRRVA
jgi:hypothetical protein